MTWLIFAVAIVAYIVIGQFVAGMLEADNLREITMATIIWPLIVTVFLFTHPFIYPFGRIRKLGKRFIKWVERKEAEYERKD